MTQAFWTAFVVIGVVCLTTIMISLTVLIVVISYNFVGQILK